MAILPLNNHSQPVEPEAKGWEEKFEVFIKPMLCGLTGVDEIYKNMWKDFIRNQKELSYKEGYKQGERIAFERIQSALENDGMKKDDVIKTIKIIKEE